MQRALQIAALGKGRVAPNPMVGAVLVHPELGIISEGWHQQYGGPHAEVHCLGAIQDPELLEKSTMYVTLEPCSHFGKTPPCADLLLEKKIKRVVICARDPHPLVAGKGEEKLKAAGMELTTGILEAEGHALNRLFFTAQTKKRPFVTLKWAETCDGFIARPDGSSKWISGPESRMLVHQFRTAHQAILVGRNTLRTDDPGLTVRDWHGPNPIRLVVDPMLELPTHLQVFTDQSAPTWIFNSLKETEENHMRWIKLNQAESDLDSLMTQLFDLGILSLFVEGGAALLNQFVAAGLWDEALVFSSEVEFTSGIKAPALLNVRQIQQTQIRQDLLSVYQPNPKQEL